MSRNRTWLGMIALVAAMTLFGAGNGFSLTTTWTAALGSNWNNAGNWDLGVPGAGDTAVVPKASSQPTVWANSTCLNLQITTAGGAVTVTIAGGITLTIADGGTINVTAGGNASNITGTGNILLSGIATVTNASTGLLTISCANLTGNGANLITFNGTGNTTVSAPIIDGASTPVTKAGAGILTLSGVNTYTGATAVNAGTLSFNAINTGVSAVTVTGAGTKLAGTGTIPGAVTMNTGTILAPGGTDGDAVGTLTITGLITFNGASKYVVTMTGGLVDKIVAGNNLVATLSLPTIWMQAGYSTAGVVVPVQVMDITGAYTAFDATNLPAGFVIDAVKVGNLIRITAAPGAIVPTLNEWGLIIMLILLAGAGVMLMRRRQRSASIAG